MGWENRDYARDTTGQGGYAGGSGFSSWPTALKYLILANILVFIAETVSVRRMTADEFLNRFVTDDNAELVASQLGIPPKAAVQSPEELKNEIKAALQQFPGRGFLPFVSPVEDWFEMDSAKVRQGQVWRLITSGFCHDRSGIFHILVNMLVLYWFGFVIESMYGSREFLLFYFFALLTSSLFILGLDTWTGQNIPAVGASGAVMGVAMLFAMHFPKFVVYLFFVIPLEARWLVILYAAYDLYPVILTLAGKPQFTGIAHAGHLGGLAFGLVYRYSRIRLDRIFGYKSGRHHLTTGSQFKVVLVDPETESPREVIDELDRAVDAILRKIQNEGTESLSEEEIRLLDQASSWYRNRDD